MQGGNGEAWLRAMQDMAKRNIAPIGSAAPERRLGLFARAWGRFVEFARGSDELVERLRGPEPSAEQRAAIEDLERRGGVW